MSDDEAGEAVPGLDLNEVELPPDVAQLLGEIRDGRKTLMRTKAFGQDVAQLRAFIGTHLFAHLEKTIALLTVDYLDAYNIAASSAHELQRLRRRVRDLEDDGSGSGALDDDDAEALTKMSDDMMQALVSLAQKLEKKVPDDKEIAKAFTQCFEIAKATQEFLVSGDEEDDEDDEDGDDEEEEEGKTPADKPKEEAPAEPPAPEQT